MIRRKIEYQDIEGTRRSYAFELPESGETYADITIDYFDDTRFLFNPLNGFVDSNLNPTVKLEQTIRNVERINQGTWEFTIPNTSRLDNRDIRGGKTTAIPTYYDIWGNKTFLVTGIGDGSNCQIERIDQEINPELMSKDKFISNMSGYAAGFSSGNTNEIAYSTFLNPVNVTNVNNFYPVLRHGYFYDGETEYYCYGNKQTEILNIAKAEVSGIITVIPLENKPNELSPILINITNTDYQKVLSDIQIGDFAGIKYNSYRKRYDFGLETLPLRIDHGLVSEIPFVYLIETDGSIVLPNVDIITKNEILVSTPGEESHGYANIIRPSTKFITYNNVDVTADGITLTHNLYTNTPFVFCKTGTALGLLTVGVLNNNQIYIPRLNTVIPTVIIFDVAGYSTTIHYASFSSGIVTHNLNLPSPAVEDTTGAYIDPWVFGMIQTIELQDELVIAETTHIDANTSYVDFGQVVSDVDLVFIDFSRLNMNESIVQGSIGLNTDMFSFQEESFYGNQGIASPFHRIYPLLSGTVEGAACIEYLPRYQTSDLSPIPFDYQVIMGSGTINVTPEPYYNAELNSIMIPSGLSSSSGTVIVTYEKEKSLAHEFRFRGTDVSPVTWYNTDRIIAIQINDYAIENISIYPDIENTTLSDVATRPIMNSTSIMEISHFPYDLVAGEPLTSFLVTVASTDNSGVAQKTKDVVITTKRRLYTKAPGTGIMNRIYDYNIEIIDNTKSLFSLSSGTISTYLIDAESDPLTIGTPSLYDKITFIESPVDEIAIYDDDGYLFTTLPGTKEYKVTFVGGIYSSDTDSFTHAVTQTTDVFGATTIKIGLHNTRRLARNKTIRVTSWPAGPYNELTAPTLATKTIGISPTIKDNSFGYTDQNDLPNLTISTMILPSGAPVAVISDHMPTPSTMRIYDYMYYLEASGILSRNISSGIIDTYDTGSHYVVEIDPMATSPFPSGVASGYVLYSSGMVLRYDIIDDEASILDRGEFYG